MMHKYDTCIGYDNTYPIRQYVYFENIMIRYMIYAY